MATKLERRTKEMLGIKEHSPDHLLHAKDVVAFAKSHKNSVLHTEFPWDVNQAAEEHWLTIARRLIATTVLVEGGNQVFVSLSVDRVQGGGYRTVGEVVKDRDLSAIMLQDALRDLVRMQMRYDKVKELVGVWKALDKVRKGKRGRDQPNP